MVTALVLFGIAAVGGLILATQRLRGAPRPTLALAVVHGAIAAAGLIALILVVVEPGAPAMARTALVVVLATAVYVADRLRD